MRLIDVDELKEHKFLTPDAEEAKKWLPAETQGYQLGWNDCIDAIVDNAPTVPLPDFKEGYKQAIIDGKTNFAPCYQTTSCLDCKMYDKENHHCPRFCEVIKELVKEANND